MRKWTTKKVIEEGVNVIPNATIGNAQINDNKVELQLVPSVKTEIAPKGMLKKKSVKINYIILILSYENNNCLLKQIGFLPTTLSLLLV